MVANWDILNKEFDDLLNRLSDDEWQEWYDHKDTQETILRLELTIKAKISEYKMFSKNFEGETILKNFLFQGCQPNSKNLTITGGIDDTSPEGSLQHIAA